MVRRPGYTQRRDDVVTEFVAGLFEFGEALEDGG
jgi:hypothetical protein